MKTVNPENAGVSDFKRFHQSVAPRLVQQLVNSSRLCKGAEELNGSLGIIGHWAVHK